MASVFTLLLVSSCIGQLSDGCGAVVHCLEHCRKPKGVGKWVHMGRVFAAAEMHRVSSHRAYSVTVKRCCIMDISFYCFWDSLHNRVPKY